MTPFPYRATGVVTIPGYTWVTVEFSLGSGLNYPTSSSGSLYRENGILVVDFSATPAPEPSGLALARVGLFGMAGFVWRKARAA
jgi:hypothetical protein